MFLQIPEMHSIWTLSKAIHCSAFPLVSLPENLLASGSLLWLYGLLWFQERDNWPRINTYPIPYPFLVVTNRRRVLLFCLNQSSVCWTTPNRTYKICIKKPRAGTLYLTSNFKLFTPDLTNRTILKVVLSNWIFVWNLIFTKELNFPFMIWNLL